MNRHVLANLMIAVAIAISDAGHTQSVAENGPNKPEYSLTINTSHPEFHSGEPIKLRVILKNISDRPFLAAKSSPPDTADLAYKTYI